MPLCDLFSRASQRMWRKMSQRCPARRFPLQLRLEARSDPGRKGSGGRSQRGCRLRPIHSDTRHRRWRQWRSAPCHSSRSRRLCRSPTRETTVDLRLPGRRQHHLVSTNATLFSYAVHVDVTAAIVQEVLIDSYYSPQVYNGVRPEDNQGRRKESWCAPSRGCRVHGGHQQSCLASLMESALVQLLRRLWQSMSSKCSTTTQSVGCWMIWGGTRA